MQERVKRDPANPDALRDFAEAKMMVGDIDGAKVTRSDGLSICQARIREGYNPRAYVKKGCAILSSWAEHLSGAMKVAVDEVLGQSGIYDDWHGVSDSTFLDAVEKSPPYWQKTFKPSVKSVSVDFNQGLDSRLALKGQIISDLSKVPVRPVRIAFDHWKLRKVYEDLNELLVKRPVEMYQANLFLSTATSVRGTSVVVGTAYGESAFMTLPREDEGRLWRWRRKNKELEVRASAVPSGRPLDVMFARFTEPFAPTEIREVSFANGGEWLAFTVT